MAAEHPAATPRLTKAEAAKELRELATVIRLSLDGDEGAEAWAGRLELIAEGLDPRG